MSLELKTALFMAMEDYEFERQKRRDDGVELTISDDQTNDKILLRVITEPKSKSGFVGANSIDEVVATIKRKDYDKGVLVSRRFTKAARRKLREEGIQIISDDFMPDFKPDKLYLTMKNFVDDLCKAKCGKVPQKKSDCKGHSNGGYSCKIRLISDNSSFHFERGWKNLLENDVFQLLSLQNSTTS
ncbi:MAG: restriction endonuclease [Candidatus Bathyarchaeia archaeon]